MKNDNYQDVGSENRVVYDAPAISIVTFKSDGIICQSPNPNYKGFGNEDDLS